MTWSKTLMIGLIAVIVVSILNLVLFKSSLAMLIVNAITMILFLGFIAFDSQNLKQIYQQNQGANLALLCDNPKYPTIIGDKHEPQEFKIIGHVVYLLKDLN